MIFSPVYTLLSIFVLTDLTGSVEAVGWGPTFDSVIGGPLAGSLGLLAVCVIVCGFVHFLCPQVRHTI